ncbi:MAG: DNA repair protein RecN [Cyclobacteriaceae bacterium]|nr:DNA repair protein RecN [Cyclobacteriaceae bacterium]
MLTHLTIKNYALIRHLEMEPSGHLNVITGETGAGKSIMLGALGLLMGNRADTKVLWDEQEKCITEGIFKIKPYNLKSFFKAEDLDYDDQTVIRREINPGGKSRAFINDTPVTLDVLRKLGAMLMDVHSQHETLMLGDKNFQLKLVDAYAGNQNLLEQYQETWQQYVQSKKEYESLQERAESLRQESDFIHFQSDELVKAGFESGEQEKLESELKIMEHAEDIKSRFNAILDLLSRSEYAAQQALTEARNQLQAVAGYSKVYEALANRLQSNIIELDDILNEIETAEATVEFDPQRAEAAKDRIDSLYRLLKKHRVNSIDELLTLQEEFQQKANLTANLDDELAKAKTDYEQKTKQMQALTEKLSKARAKVFESLCKEITQLLNEVGIPQASLRIEHSRISPTNYGGDSIDLLFSANKGIAPRPLGDVASGGEFSRLMFCIKYVMAEKTEMPTLVLDEIDTGVSGEIAIKLGKLMKSMAKKHQLITISHLPQIAAKADTHYFVFKDNSSKKTISSIKCLTDQERVEEIAKMIGGEKPSKVAVENARELLVS